MMAHKKVFSVLVSCILASIVFPRVYGDNPDLSLWLKNLSEPSGTSQPVLSDYASEIAISGNTIHVLWLADSSYYKHYIFYRRSIDNGNTWEDKIKFEEVPQHGIDNGASSKRMVVSGDYVHIVYSRHSPYDEIIYIRSTDGGATFEEPRILSPALFVEELYVSASEEKVSVLLYAHWIEGNFYVMSSVDNGDNFTSGFIGYTPNADEWTPRDLLRDGDYIYALTQKYFWNPVCGCYSDEIYFSVSSDGNIFQNMKVSNPSADGTDKTNFLQDQNYLNKIAISGPNVYLIWSGLDENDNANVFVRHSPDRGQTWDDVVNISMDQLAPGELPQGGQEAIIAKGNYVYAMFLSKSGYIYVSTSSNSGESFSEAEKITAPAGTAHIDSGWWPNCIIDPTDPTGQTAHFIWSYPVYVCTRDGGITFSKPVTIGTEYSWRGSTQRPRISIGEDGIVHYITEGQYSLDGYSSDSDIFYRRLDVAPEPSDDGALKLGYNPPGERYDNMAVPSSASLHFSDQITVEAWIKPDPGTERNSRIVTKEDLRSYTYHPKAYQIATHDYANGRYANAGILTTTGEYVNWGDKLSEGEWNHIAMTYNSQGGENNFTLFINGQLSTSLTATGDLMVGDGMLIIGPTRDSEGFNGLVDEVRIWNHELSLDEILARMYIELQGSENGLAAYYNFNNTTKDISGHGNDGILMYREEFVTSPITAPDGDQDGVSDLEEWGPNGDDYTYDGNSDGIADWQQGCVSSLFTFLKNRYVSLAALAELSLINVTAVEGPGFTPEGYNFPYGFFEFSLQLIPGRFATTVELFLPDGLAVDSHYNYGFLPAQRSPEWYEFLYDQETGATIGQNMITLAFVDGLKGDHDLADNGTIVTMGGPAKESEGIDEPGYERGVVRIFPNPCNGYADIHYYASGSGPIRLDLYNVRGEKIEEIINGPVNPGEYTYNYQTGHLKNGVYYLHLIAGTYQETRKMVVIN